jgi:hypothetical protein
MATHRREALSRVLDELSGEEMAALLVGMKAIHTARARVLAARAGEAAAAEGGPCSGRTP